MEPGEESRVEEDTASFFLVCMQCLLDFVDAIQMPKKQHKLIMFLHYSCFVPFWFALFQMSSSSHSDEESLDEQEAVGMGKRCESRKSKDWGENQQAWAELLDRRGYPRQAYEGIIEQEHNLNEPTWGQIHDGPTLVDQAISDLAEGD